MMIYQPPQKLKVQVPFLLFVADDFKMRSFWQANQRLLNYISMNRTDVPWSESFMQSPITGKYYLQFNNNYLIDIIRQAVRDIIIYDSTLRELPISELQKEIFLIYDNTNIKPSDLEALLREEFRIAARFQKNMLDLTYAQIEKNRDNISDMREDDNPWNENFKIYHREAPESSRKTYAVIASMFLNSFFQLCKAVNQAALLLDILIEESILPPFNLLDTCEGSINLILAQFNDNPFQAGGPNLTDVISCMTQKLKRSFVTCQARGQDLRRMLCRYDPHVGGNIMDLFVQPQLTFPMFDFKPQPAQVDQRKEEMSMVMDRMLFGRKDELEIVRDRPQKKIEDKEYKMLRQFARFWKGYDNNEDDEDVIYEQLKQKHQQFLKFLDEKQKERAQKANNSQNEQKCIQAEPTTSNSGLQKMQKLFFEKVMNQIDQSSTPQLEEQPKKSEEIQKIHQNPPREPPIEITEQLLIQPSINQNQIIQQTKPVNPPQLPEQTKETSKQPELEVPEAKQQKQASKPDDTFIKQKEQKEEKQQKVVQIQLKQTITTQIANFDQPKIQIISKQPESLPTPQQIKQKEVIQLAMQAPPPPKQKPRQMCKKTGKNATKQQLLHAAKLKRQYDLKKQLKNQPLKLPPPVPVPVQPPAPAPIKNSQGDDLIKFKLTKDELRKLQKKNQITRITAEQAAYLNSKQFKKASENSTNNDHIYRYLYECQRAKLQMKAPNNAVDVQKKPSFAPEMIEKLSKYTMIVGSDDEQQFTTLASPQVTSRIQKLLKSDEEKDKETQESKEAQESKKKKNKKNKKKKNKKNQLEDQQEIDKTQMKQSSSPSKKEEIYVPVQKSQEEKSLVNFLENLKIEEKDRFQCFPRDDCAKKWKTKMQKWKSNI